MFRCKGEQVQRGCSSTHTRGCSNWHCRVEEILPGRWAGWWRGCSRKEGQQRLTGYSGGWRGCSRMEGQQRLTGCSGGWRGRRGGREVVADGGEGAVAGWKGSATQGSVQGADARGRALLLLPHSLAILWRLGTGVEGRALLLLPLLLTRGAHSLTVVRRLGMGFAGATALADAGGSCPCCCRCRAGFAGSSCSGSILLVFGHSNRKNVRGADAATALLAGGW